MLSIPQQSLLFTLPAILPGARITRTTIEVSGGEGREETGGGERREETTPPFQPMVWPSVHCVVVVLSSRLPA